MAIAPATAFDRRPDLAALANALLVIVGPMILALTLPVLFPSDSVTVRPADAPVIARTLRDLAQMGITLLPFAVLAGWRTRVHAIAWCERGDRGWRGVVEAGLGGFLIAVLVLLPATLRRPLDAPPYILAYGGLALIVGLVFGFVLRISALVVLQLATPREPIA